YKAANQDFLITDGERVTWRYLYLSVAEAFGVEPSNIPSIDSAAVYQAIGTDLGSVSHRPTLPLKNVGRQVARAARNCLPPIVSRAVRAVLPPRITKVIQRWDGPLPGSQPQPDWETLSLQCCHYMLPIDKAHKSLGYVPRIAFAEGSRRSQEWLRFAFGM